MFIDAMIIIENSSQVKKLKKVCIEHKIPYVNDIPYPSHVMLYKTKDNVICIPNAFTEEEEKEKNNLKPYTLKQFIENIDNILQKG